MAGGKFMTRMAATQKGLSRFAREIRSELKRVIWPTRQQLVNNTVTVLVTCLLVGVIIWIADYGIKHAVQFVLK